MKDTRSRYQAMTPEEQRALKAVCESDQRSVSIDDNDAAETLAKLDIIGGGQPDSSVYRVNHNRACEYCAFVTGLKPVKVYGRL